MHTLTSGASSPLGLVVDTSTLLSVNYLRPLLTSAVFGDLAVSWSLPIQREVAKVVFREGVLASIRTLQGSSTAELVPSVRATFNSLSEALEALFIEVDRGFRLVTNLDDVNPLLVEVIRDPADRMILRTALAGGTRIILSLDRRHLPHGASFHSVQCWHPDTFLTLFYQQNPLAYRRASEGVRTLPKAIRRLLP